MTEKKSGGKNLRLAYSKLEHRVYSLDEALDILKEINFAKFDPTIEIAMNLGVDPKHSDQVVRGVVQLPCGLGKIVRVAVIVPQENVSQALEYGADLAGEEELISDIKKGKIDFDVCITIPSMMAKISSIAKILGPRGLMPNPKLGTVTPDFKTAIDNAKKGQVEFRVDKQGIIHSGIGKLSFSNADLTQNISVFTDAIIKAKPSGSKGQYLKSIYISCTMSPALQIRL